MLIAELCVLASLSLPQFLHLLGRVTDNVFSCAGERVTGTVKCRTLVLLSVLHLEGKSGGGVRGDPRPPSSKGGNRQQVRTQITIAAAALPASLPPLLLWNILQSLAGDQNFFPPFHAPG